MANRHSCLTVVSDDDNYYYYYFYGAESCPTGLFEAHTRALTNSEQYATHEQDYQNVQDIRLLLVVLSIVQVPVVNDY